MEHSTNSEAVLRLGKRLVQELQLEPGVDTLSKWMAHYIAELMEEAEASPPEHADAAQERCFDCILQLWRHLADEGRIRTEFETYGGLIDTLQRLSNPDRPYYFDAATKLENESLGQAREIDSAARAILWFLLTKASGEVSDSEQEWIELAQRLPADAQGNVPFIVLKMRWVLAGDSEDDDAESRSRRLIESARTGIAHLRSVLDAIEKGVDEEERKLGEVEA